ncbi:MAG: TolC family protein [Bacteroidota bacterium]
MLNPCRLHQKRGIQRFILLTLGLGLAALTKPVSAAFSKPSSGDSLSLEQFLGRVRQSHPVITQARILADQGLTQIQEARGAMDPRVSFMQQRKTWEDKLELGLQDFDLRVPTLLGPDFYVGFDQSEGSKINPQSGTIPGGQWKSGVRLPLGREGWINRRRTDLRQAYVMADMASAQRDQIINDILLDAAQDYHRWEASQRQTDIYTEALGIANDVLNFIRYAAEIGERPFIDTLEAGIQQRTWQQRLEEARIKEIEARFALAVHLWDSLGVNELSRSYRRSVHAVVLPSPAPVQDSATYAGYLAEHPRIQMLQNEIAQQELELRWLRSRLLPLLDLEWSLTPLPGSSPSYNIGSGGQFTGINVDIPIFLRRERARIERQKLNLTSRQWQLEWTSAGLRQDLDRSLQQYNLYRNLLVLQEKLVVENRRMLEAEKTRFQAGESNVFLLNQREVNLINAEVKVVELQLQQHLNVLQQYHLSGLMNRYTLQP